MAITFLLAPSPKWYFFDAEGKLAANGSMATFNSDDKITPKPVFSDPAGSFPYPNPILLDGTGGTPVPLYWEEGGATKYFVVIKDNSGRIITTIDNYPIVAGSGGTPVTINADVENFLINGNFHLISNDIFGGITSNPTVTPIPNLPVTPPQGFTRVAPGGGSIGLLSDGYYTSGSVVTNAGALTTSTEKVTTGWLFEKEGGGGITDTISFVDTIPGAAIPTGPSQNAPRYFQYSAASAGATTKLDLEYIINDVRTFAGKTIHISFDVSGNVANANNPFLLEQNFGTGGTPSPTVETPAAVFDFTDDGSWARRPLVSIVVPAIAGNIGTDRNSSLRLKWRFPQNTIGSFNITNLQLQTGTAITNDFIYQTYNQSANKTIMEMISAHLPQTGDMKWSTVPSGASPTGWIVIAGAGETIGKSGSSFAGEVLRNLYRLWWNYPDAIFPVVSGRGGSADADFDANKHMTMNVFAGYVFGVAGGSSSVLDFVPLAGDGAGEQNHKLTIPELAIHSHSYDTFNPLGLTGDAGLSATIQTSPQTGDAGGDVPHNTMQPTRFWWLHIKL